jgi:D-sedoheptulose 7-phosphate isomerase|tara:strand:+ start:295 stop:882 length:588 start_codon:yes stop_codon:yes gene_type:complete
METNLEKINKLFVQSSDVILESKLLSQKINDSIKLIISSLEHKNKILIFGNGGSASDAQHMAAEFISRYLLERISLPAIALTTDTSILTSIGNDYNFDKIFSRQCESLVNEGDIIIAISTSGKSQNVILGIEEAKRKGAKIISLTGNNGGILNQISDICLEIPSNETPRIQEGHRILIHIICELVESHFKNVQSI